MIKCSCGYRIGHPSFPECICNKTSGWQYLTDDEILEIISGGRISEGSIGYEGGIGAYTRELFDKIQAKIREKNSDT